MKKFFLTFILVMSAFLSIAALSASAERYYSLPITMTQAESHDEGYVPETYFTLTDFNTKPTYDYSISNSDEERQIYLKLFGYFSNSGSSTFWFNLHCYDISGNHIATRDFSIYDWGDGVYSTTLVIPELTAFIELESKQPSSWSNTYYYGNYRNIWSADGRVMAIPELQLPLYEAVGWYGDITLYSIDGRTINVPYPEVEAYKKVYWYDYQTYLILKFRNDYSYNLSIKNYNAIFEDIERLLYDTYLGGSQYEQELYTAKTYTMDMWRNQANTPLVCTDYEYNEYSNWEYDPHFTAMFRNISYKTIVEFTYCVTYKTSYGTNKTKYITMLGEDNEEEFPVIPPGSELFYGHTRHVEVLEDFGGNSTIDISKPIVTKVIFTDGTVWSK